MFDVLEQQAASIGGIDSLVELGIFHGGSTVLLSELLRPKRLMAFDRCVAEDPNIEPFWGVDQSDAALLRSVIGDDPLDLVVDDASHLYEPTVASFDALFPRL